MIPSVPIAFLEVSDVLLVTIKAPYMATPTSTKNGTHWLSLVRPRRSKGLYRTQFHGFVVRNDTVNKLLGLAVPDLRNINRPDITNLLLYQLEITYDKIEKALVFKPTTPMPPEVTISVLNRTKMIGNAAKLRNPIHVPCFPVLIT